MMKVQNQTQQMPEEECLIPLSEDEQDCIQGGAFFIPLAIAAARVAAPHVVRAFTKEGLTRAAKRRIVTTAVSLSPSSSVRRRE
jgi:hypothetical protein